MGYRLEISKTRYIACGGKLFGYEDVNYLRSWHWLKERHYIDGDEYWSYGCNPRILLSPEDFREFIKLYAQDYEEYYNLEKGSFFDEETKKAMRNRDYKLLEWY